MYHKSMTHPLLDFKKLFIIYPKHSSSDRTRHSSGWHHGSLSWIRSHFLYHAIGIALCDVQELGATRSLIVGAGCIHHVAEVIKFVAQFLVLDPTLISRPSMRVLRVDGTGSIEIAIWLLCSTHHIEHAVDVSLQ